jgi:hypothetical protein
MQRLFVNLIVLLSTLAAFTGGVSAALPFERHGTIERINAHQGFIVINDVTYLLPASARVHFFAPKGQKPKDQVPPPDAGNAFVLREGMYIGYRIEGEGPGRQGRLVEAWILPPGTISKSRD